SFWKRIFVVQTIEGKQLGIMKYTNAFTKAQANIESTDGNWIIRKKSFWIREIQMNDKSSEIILCTAKYNGWKREMKCTIDYNNFIFRSKGFWRSKFIWENESGEILVEYKSKQAIKFNSTVTVSDAAVKLKQLSLLTFIGLYQINAIRAGKGAQ
ncbi:MAG: hypothetical protein WCI97_06310, partial [Bacteroidota bacterium]